MSLRYQPFATLPARIVRLNRRPLADAAPAERLVPPLLLKFPVKRRAKMKTSHRKPDGFSSAAIAAVRRDEERRGARR